MRFQPLFSGGNEPAFPEPAPGTSPRTAEPSVAEGSGGRGRAHNGAWEVLPETRPGQLSLGRWIRVCIEIVRAQPGWEGKEDWKGRGKGRKTERGKGEEGRERRRGGEKKEKR